jgi:hypothetical protein
MAGWAQVLLSRLFVGLIHGIWAARGETNHKTAGRRETGKDTPRLEIERITPMLELALLVCLADNPSKCKEESLVYSTENLTPMQCLMGAQAEIAKWSEYHPRWVAKKWTCRQAGKFANL